jgi:hypothetical protein
MRTNPDRAPLIRQAFELFANGRDQRAVLRAVSASALPACRTTAQSLNNLLRNPAYAGPHPIARRWNSEHEGDFDPIVSEALYSGVQARLAAINSHPSRTTAG